MIRRLSQGPRFFNDTDALTPSQPLACGCSCLAFLRRFQRQTKRNPPLIPTGIFENTTPGGAKQSANPPPPRQAEDAKPAAHLGCALTCAFSSSSMIGPALQAGSETSQKGGNQGSQGYESYEQGVCTSTLRLLCSSGNLKTIP